MAINAGLVRLAVLAILNSAMSLYYYLRIINYIYLKELTGPKIAEPKGYAAALILTLIGVIYIGVFPQPFYKCRQQQFCCLTKLFLSCKAEEEA